MESINQVETYSADGRAPLFTLYARYWQLVEKYGWTAEIMYTQNKLAAYAFFSPNRGRALWLTSGIHGEEPAGPNAVALSIDFLAQLAKTGLAIVLRPLCNPFGYVRNWRYYDEVRDWRKGHSVGDAEHLLPDLKNPNQPRFVAATNPYAEKLTEHILKTLKSHPPILALDLHEDEVLANSYLYISGRARVVSPLAREIIKILHASGLSVQMRGQTRFGEPIINGIVANAKDSSIDELLAADTIFQNGRKVEGPKVEMVIVVETPTLGLPLAKRIAAHKNIIHAGHFLTG